MILLKLLFVFYLIFISGNLLFIDKYYGTYIFITLTFFIVIFLQIKRTKIKKKYIKFFIIIFFPIIASQPLSCSPKYSLASFMGFLMTSIVALYCARKIYIWKFIKIFIFSSFIIFSFSILLVLLPNKLGIDNQIHIGAWRGIFDHKNTLGLFSILYFSISIFYFILTKRKWYLLNTLFSIILIINSHSRTAILSLFVSLVIVFLHNLDKNFGKILLKNKLSFIDLFFIFLIGSFLIAIYTHKLNIGNIGSSLDYMTIFDIKIPLSGRLSIWLFCIESINVHPILGYGYNAFWKTSFSVDVSDTGLGKIILHDAHNGIINSLLSFGYLGLFYIIVLLSFILFYFRRKYLSFQYNTCLFFYYYYSLIFIISNLTESTLYKSTNIYQFFFLYVIFSWLSYKENRKIYSVPQR